MIATRYYVCVDAHDEALWEKILSALQNVEAGRQHLVDTLWAQIPRFVEEFGYTPDGTTVEADPVVVNLVRITGLLVVTPIGTTSATLQLGDRVFELQNTTTFWTPLSILLAERDERLLTFAPSGAASLYLWGTQVPTTGLMR